MAGRNDALGPEIAELTQLILDYTGRTRVVVAQLQQEFGVVDLLEACRERVMPRRGELSDGSRYFFHGIGCRVHGHGTSIDFDFGTQGRIDGFDAWRLWCFAKQFRDRYPRFQELRVVRDAVQRMVNDGVVVPSGVEDDHLLYLKATQ